MPRRSPAEIAAAAVKKLLDRREHLLQELAKVNGQLTEIGAQVGAPVADINITATEVLARTLPVKPAMAEPRMPTGKPVPGVSLDRLMADARREDAFPVNAFERKPYVPHEERDGAPERDATTSGISPADNQGAGRWI